MASFHVITAVEVPVENIDPVVLAAESGGLLVGSK